MLVVSFSPLRALLLSSFWLLVVRTGAQPLLPSFASYAQLQGATLLSLEYSGWCSTSSTCSVTDALNKSVPALPLLPQCLAYSSTLQTAYYFALTRQESSILRRPLNHTIMTPVTVIDGMSETLLMISLGETEMEVRPEEIAGICNTFTGICDTIVFDCVDDHHIFCINCSVSGYVDCGVRNNSVQTLHRCAHIIWYDMSDNWILAEPNFLLPKNSNYVLGDCHITFSENLSYTIIARPSSYRHYLPHDANDMTDIANVELRMGHMESWMNYFNATYRYDGPFFRNISRWTLCPQDVPTPAPMVASTMLVSSMMSIEMNPSQTFSSYIVPVTSDTGSGSSNTFTSYLEKMHSLSISRRSSSVSQVAYLTSSTPLMPSRTPLPPEDQLPSDDPITPDVQFILPSLDQFDEPLPKDQCCSNGIFSTKISFPYVASMALLSVTKIDIRIKLFIAVALAPVSANAQDPTESQDPTTQPADDEVVEGVTQTPAHNVSELNITEAVTQTPAQTVTAPVISTESTASRPIAYHARNYSVHEDHLLNTSSLQVTLDEALMSTFPNDHYCSNTVWYLAGYCGTNTIHTIRADVTDYYHSFSSVLCSIQNDCFPGDISYKNYSTNTHLAKLLVHPPHNCAVNVCVDSTADIERALIYHDLLVGSCKPIIDASINGSCISVEVIEHNTINIRSVLYLNSPVALWRAETTNLTVCSKNPCSDYDLIDIRAAIFNRTDVFKIARSITYSISGSVEEIYNLAKKNHYLANLQLAMLFSHDNPEPKPSHARTEYIKCQNGQTMIPTTGEFLSVQSTCDGDVFQVLRDGTTVHVGYLAGGSLSFHPEVVDHSPGFVARVNALMTLDQSRVSEADLLFQSEVENPGLKKCINAYQICSSVCKLDCSEVLHITNVDLTPVCHASARLAYNCLPEFKGLVKNIMQTEGDLNRQCSEFASLSTNLKYEAAGTQKGYDDMVEKGIAHCSSRLLIDKETKSSLEDYNTRLSNLNAKFQYLSGQQVVLNRTLENVLTRLSAVEQAQDLASTMYDEMREKLVQNTDDINIALTIAREVRDHENVDYNDLLQKLTTEQGAINDLRAAQEKLQALNDQWEDQQQLLYTLIGRMRNALENNRTSEYNTIELSVLENKRHIAETEVQLKQTGDDVHNAVEAMNELGIHYANYQDATDSKLEDIQNRLKRANDERETLKTNVDGIRDMANTINETMYGVAIAQTILNHDTLVQLGISFNDFVNKTAGEILLLNQSSQELFKFKSEQEVLNKFNKDDLSRLTLVTGDLQSQVGRLDNLATNNRRKILDIQKVDRAQDAVTKAIAKELGRQTEDLNEVKGRVTNTVNAVKKQGQKLDDIGKQVANNTIHLGMVDTKLNQAVQNISETQQDLHNFGDQIDANTGAIEDLGDDLAEVNKTVSQNKQGVANNKKEADAVKKSVDGIKKNGVDHAKNADTARQAEQAGHPPPPVECDMLTSLTGGCSGGGGGGPCSKSSGASASLKLFSQNQENCNFNVIVGDDNDVSDEHGQAESQEAAGIDAKGFGAGGILGTALGAVALVGVIILAAWLMKIQSQLNSAQKITAAVTLSMAFALVLSSDIPCGFSTNEEFIIGSVMTHTEVRWINGTFNNHYVYFECPMTYTDQQCLDAWALNLFKEMDRINQSIPIIETTYHSTCDGDDKSPFKPDWLSGVDYDTANFTDYPQELPQQKFDMFPLMIVLIIISGWLTSTVIICLAERHERGSHRRTLVIVAYSIMCFILFFTISSAENVDTTVKTCEYQSFDAMSWPELENYCYMNDHTSSCCDYIKRKCIIPDSSTPEALEAYWYFIKHHDLQCAALVDQYNQITLSFGHVDRPSSVVITDTVVTIVGGSLMIILLILMISMFIYEKRFSMSTGNTACFGMLVFLGCINPIHSHNGDTVFVNTSPGCDEAEQAFYFSLCVAVTVLVYGVVVTVALIYPWLRARSYRGDTTIKHASAMVAQYYSGVQPPGWRSGLGAKLVFVIIWILHLPISDAMPSGHLQTKQTTPHNHPIHEESSFPWAVVISSVLAGILIWVLLNYIYESCTGGKCKMCRYKTVDNKCTCGCQCIMCGADPNQCGCCSNCCTCSKSECSCLLRWFFGGYCLSWSGQCCYLPKWFCLCVITKYDCKKFKTIEALKEALEAGRALTQSEFSWQYNSNIMNFLMWALRRYKYTENGTQVPHPSSKLTTVATQRSMNTSAIQAKLDKENLKKKKPAARANAAVNGLFGGPNSNGNGNGN